MTARSVRLSRAADRDIRDAIAHYAAEAGEKVAMGFREALKDAMELLSRFPHIGSTALGAAVSRPAVRTWPLSGFPYLVVYEQSPDSVYVVRVLHTRQDIPASLR